MLMDRLFTNINSLKQGGKHMTNNKALSIFNQLRPVTVGFDNVFDHFERMFDDEFFRLPTASNFPPYNIVKTGKNTYDVELAVAGFGKDDIEVQYEDNMLTVKSKKVDRTEDKDEDGDIIHRGISKRFFSKSFTIADDVEVKGAELKDGLLKVSMERIIPEGKKAKTIDIK
jgi:molecular chaperone IbpA